ncbi:MAG: glycosyl hydrolase family 8 [Myxococcota bacterium]
MRLLRVLIVALTVSVSLGGTAQAAPTPASVRAEWGTYVDAFIQSDGRVIDRAGDDVSTSEGQAYALIRAVWCDDRATFDKVLIWTRNNLQAGDDTKLPAWRWGRRPDGSWGVLDANSASDADQWMAWALLLGAEKWKAPSYEKQAKALLHRIWDEETAAAGSRRVLLPGSWEQGKATMTLNPSYWLPFAWRTFAKHDKERDWKKLVDDAYVLWDACTSPSGLPPDWCWIEASSGRIVAPPPGEELRAAFGFEAFRIGWTLAAEARWHCDDRAKRQLAAYGTLLDRWKADRTIPAVILPDGSARHTWSYLGLYGALLPAWAVVRPNEVDELFVAEVRGSRDPASARDYYAHNWVWFGLALWSGLARPEAK